MPSVNSRPAGIKEAYQQYEREERIRTGKWACLLVIVLMPVGIGLDYAVHDDEKIRAVFALVRILCSVAATVLLALHFSPRLAPHFRLLGLPIALLPAASIAGMIYMTDGHRSPYYAGLNLVLLAVSVVVHWNVKESLAAVLLVIAMYIAACHFQGPITDPGIFMNNLYFLGLTGFIVVIGNFLFSRLQFREFALRFELDQNRQTLEQTNQRLVELDRVKSRFFANISHELRTPLTLLLAPLESLLSRLRASAGGEVRPLLTTMQANGMRLLKLINDLLDLVRLESGRMELKPEPFSLPDFLKGITSAARQVAEGKNIDLQLELPRNLEPTIGWVMMDRDKLEKILLNLVFNGLKFTPVGGRVILSAKRAGDSLLLSVSDTGIGLSPQQLPFIFDRFWQAESASNRKFQGAGIGLSLVKELVEIHLGVVAVESHEGKGTTFTITLPYLEAEPVVQQEQFSFARQAGADLEPEGGPASPIQSEEWLASLYRRAELFPALASLQESGKRTPKDEAALPHVLIADDEPDMLRFLKGEFRGIFQVIEATDGQQALEKAEQFVPDLILLDMMMPGKDGLQVCQELRQKPGASRIPVLMLTARADEETKLAALSAGASDFLAKPFSTTELRVRAQNLVSLSRFERKLSRQNNLLEQTVEQLKETEMQLVQMGKLASLGRMSAGLIHEINNPLNFASTGVFTLRKKNKQLLSPHQVEYEEVLQDVDAGLQRVKKIVSDLRTFTHPSTELIELVPVQDLLHSALLFLSSEWKDKVTIVKKFPAKLAIRANRNKLLQVLLNLLQNALDALKSKTWTNNQPTIWIEGEEKKGKIRLMIKDNGQGIDPENLDKIFDPFFTTKEIGKGMGLGLSICYRIVQDFQGTISAESQPEEGTRFTLEFPAAAEAAPAQEPSNSAGNQSNR